MTVLDIIGYSAGILVTGSLIPQMIKSLKTKSTKDISLVRYLVYILGIILWIVYSVILGSKPMIISNFIALIFAFSILLLKIKYS